MSRNRKADRKADRGVDKPVATMDWPANALSMEHADSVEPVAPAPDATVAPAQSFQEPPALPTISVIIPAYDHLDGVLRCLNSLRALAANPNGAPHTYYVQDDASPNTFYPGLIPDEIASLERNETNLGFAANCNKAAQRAIEKATGDILLFVNQDVQAVYGWSDGWDAALLAAFADPRVGIVGARLLFPTGAIQSVGGVFDQLGQPAHRCLGWANPHYPACATAREVEWVTGAALAVRRAVFQALGGFDEGYVKGYFEDVDLCLRARLAGWNVWIEPRCTLIHSVGSTGGSPYFAQNARRFKQRWVDSGIVKPGTTPARQRFW